MEDYEQPASLQRQGHEVVNCLPDQKIFRDIPL